nr:hypothetical protein [Micromonospora sp. DSM 115978]
TFRFTGVRLELYGIREPGGGRMAVSLNGNLVRIIDLYQPTPALAAIYRTAVLPAGNHVVTVVNLGQRSAASRGFSVGLDRAVIYRDATPPPVLSSVVEDSNVGTGVGQLLYSGAWTICGGCVPPTPNGSFRYSSAASASVTIRFSGVRLDLYAIRERSGGRMSVSVDGAPPTVVDLYAPTSSAPLA